MPVNRLQDDELDDLLDQIPALAGRPRVVEELPGGLTNRNLKVTMPAGSFVARCSAPNAHVLGIDRGTLARKTGFVWKSMWTITVRPPRRLSASPRCSRRTSIPN